LCLSKDCHQRHRLPRLQEHTSLPLLPLLLRHPLVLLLLLVQHLQLH
jgi:hypothetical protein